MRQILQYFTKKPIIMFGKENNPIHLFCICHLATTQIYLVSHWRCPDPGLETTRLADCI